MNIKKSCNTIEPDFKTRLSILKSLQSAKFIDNGETINIGVVYHICYQGYNQTEVDLDIQHVMEILNKDFNKNADNFNNGTNIYSNLVQNIKLYPYHKYRKRLQYIRISRRVRGRKLRRYQRINARRRRSNIRINRINRRLRVLNKRLRKLNQSRINLRNKYTSYNNVYNNYVNRAGTMNVNFQHIQTIYHPLPTITSDDLNIIDQQVKINGSSVISPDKYLNIWIININNGLLGYAQFPWENNSATDGVVVSHYAFGRNPVYTDYNLNKTLVHEVGHWMGLYHVFQSSFSGQEGILDNNDDGIISINERTGDLVSDTPLQHEPTFGNPYLTPTSWPSLSMYMNFMDYSDDINLFMFTAEQCMKVRQLLSIYRPMLSII